MATAKSWALFSFSLARRNVIYKAKRKLSVILGYFETNCYAGYNENEKKSFCFSHLFSLRRYVEGLPFFNRRYTKGVPFVWKKVHKMVNLHSSISHCRNAYEDSLPSPPLHILFALSLFFSPGSPCEDTLPLFLLHVCRITSRKERDSLCIETRLVVFYLMCWRP